MSRNYFAIFGAYRMLDLLSLQHHHQLRCCHIKFLKKSFTFQAKRQFLCILQLKFKKYPEDWHHQEIKSPERTHLAAAIQR